MFLERFLIGNLWNAGLICVMFILKRVIPNRVSPRFHYYSWFILLASLLISFLPAMIWNDLPSLMPESQQAMATYHIASNTDAVVTGDSQWISMQEWQLQRSYHTPKIQAQRMTIIGSQGLCVLG